VAKGGPDGGNGGRGGDVWLVADSREASLIELADHPHRRAQKGTHGSGKNRNGRKGADLDVLVPVGTVVKNRSGEILADLAVAGDRWLAASGGRGGLGNAALATRYRRAPHFAQQGEPGEENWYDLELRLLADVALVGFPNAGKSTLLSRISAARPKIADYPFTTLVPNLGVVRVNQWGSRPHGADFVVADVPGLIEGAAEGKGLGHDFLRHVERARVLVFLLDLSVLAPESPKGQLEVLETEIERYRPELLFRPRLVVGSKADASEWKGDEERCWELQVSSVTGQGLGELVARLAESVLAARDSQPLVMRAPVVVKPAAEGIYVHRDFDGAWIVEGRLATRAVALSDLEDPEALSFAQQRLARIGVERALRRAGARSGDLVRIGDFEWTYEEDSDGSGGSAGSAGSGGAG